MITGLLRFLFYNLLPSLAAGILAWLTVIAALGLLRARSAFLHTSFLALPMVKSLLVLCGIGLIFPWPGGWFQGWQRQALQASEMLPFALLWFGASASLYSIMAWRGHAHLLGSARAPAGEDALRLGNALSRVMAAYQASPCCQAGEISCCISNQIPAHPLLLVSDGLRTPVALTKGGVPAVIFPRALVSLLEDEELTLALAHELNHFALRKPVLRSSGLVWALMLASPIAFLLADYLHREEEKACDDLAVMILGRSDVYAGMLLKCYQFSRQRTGTRQLRFFPTQPELLRANPFLTERVERLLKPEQPENQWLRSPLISYALWIALLYGLFFARFSP